MSDTTSGPVRTAKGRRVWLGLAAAAALLGFAPQKRRMIKSAKPDADIGIHARPRELANLNFADGQGRETSLAAYRGRVVLLNVWATWCLPCREEMPTLDRLQALLGGPDFEVVALSIDQGGLPAVKAFFERTGIRHLRPYLDAAGAALSTLATTGVPLTLLVDRSGREIGRKLGPAAWDDPAVVGLLRERIQAAESPQSLPG